VRTERYYMFLTLFHHSAQYRSKRYALTRLVLYLLYLLDPIRLLSLKPHRPGTASDDGASSHFLPSNHRDKRKGIINNVSCTINSFTASLPPFPISCMYRHVSISQKLSSRWSHADGAIADVARPQNHFGDIQSSGSDLSKPEKSAKPAATDACIWDYLFMI
jgi:hypothetical protein